MSQKRHPTLHELTTEHQHKLTIVRRARDGAADKDDTAPKVVLEEVLVMFSTEVEPHFRREEEGLVVALEAKGQTLLVSRITAEHQAIREIVSSAASISPRVSLLALADALERHIHFEERALLESAQQHLDAAALDAIGAAASASKANTLQSGRS